MVTLLYRTYLLTNRTLTSYVQWDWLFFPPELEKVVCMYRRVHRRVYRIVEGRWMAGWLLFLFLGGGFFSVFLSFFLSCIHALQLEVVIARLRRGAAFCFVFFFLFSFGNRLT